MIVPHWRMSLFGLIWLAAVGCKSLFAPRGIPDDPMLLSRQPIESKGQVTPERPLAHHEPMPPGANKRFLASPAEKSLLD
jgi:hypothetical protein